MIMTAVSEHTRTRLVRNAQKYSQEATQFCPSYLWHVPENRRRRLQLAPVNSLPGHNMNLHSFLVSSSELQIHLESDLALTRTKSTAPSNQQH